MALGASTSTTHTYRGRSEVNFFINDNGGLSVTIDTERLHIRSIEPKEDEYSRYAALFGDKAVMEKLATGETRTKDQITKRINDVWVKRWREKDPYGGLAVFKNDSDDFLGHVSLAPGENAGESELSYLFHQAYWRKGYGTEAVTAVVKEYAPATVQEKYLRGGKPLELIFATARVDNPGSFRILEKVGMHRDGQEKKYGTSIYHYSIALAELQKKPNDECKSVESQKTTGKKQ